MVFWFENFDTFVCLTNFNELNSFLFSLDIPNLISSYGLYYVINPHMLYMIAMKFQRLHPCFRDQATRRDYTGNTVLYLGVL